MRKRVRGALVEYAVFDGTSARMSADVNAENYRVLGANGFKAEELTVRVFERTLKVDAITIPVAVVVVRRRVI